MKKRHLALAALATIWTTSAFSQITLDFTQASTSSTSLGSVTFDFAVDGAGVVTLDATSAINPATADNFDGVVGTVSSLDAYNSTFSMSFSAADSLGGGGTVWSNNTGFGANAGQNPAFRIGSTDTFTELLVTGFDLTNLGAANSVGVSGATFTGVSGDPTAVVTGFDTSTSTSLASTGAIVLSGEAFELTGGSTGSISFGTGLAESGQTVSGYALESLTFDIVAVPEPGTYGLLGGLLALGVAGMRRRIRK